MGPFTIIHTGLTKEELGGTCTLHWVLVETWLKFISTQVSILTAVSAWVT